jgi:hypothetical protein
VRNGRRYVAQLLRLWQAEVNGRLAWRASLQDVATGQRRSFASLEALVAYLRELTAETEEQAEPSRT